MLSGAMIITMAVLAASCKDDNSSTVPIVTSDMDDLQNGIDGLANFSQDALAGEEAQVATSPEVGALLTSVGLPGLDIPFGGFSQTPILSWLRRDVVGKARTPMRPRVHNLETHFGTYDRDVNDSTEPFQGWVLADGQTPSDGFIFRFDLQDDISWLDDMGNEVPLQGEIRFLDIVIDKGNLADPLDDILTNIVFEIAASPVLGPLPKLVRFNLNIVLDSNREPASLTLGSAEANNTLHPDAAFLGNLLIALSVDITPSVLPLTDLTAFAQLFDSVENFVLRFDLSMTNIDLAADLPPESMTISFGFGVTSIPSSPPWSIFATLDTFTEVQGLTGEYDFDVDGGVTFNGSSVATFAGNSQEVPVDINGDGVIDELETCPDIDITFADDPETSWNICIVLPLLDDIVPALF